MVLYSTLLYYTCTVLINSLVLYSSFYILFYMYVIQIYIIFTSWGFYSGTYPIFIHLSTPFHFTSWFYTPVIYIIFKKYPGSFTYHKSSSLLVLHSGLSIPCTNSIFFSFSLQKMPSGGHRRASPPQRPKRRRTQPARLRSQSPRNRSRSPRTRSPSPAPSVHRTDRANIQNVQPDPRPDNATLATVADSINAMQAVMLQQQQVFMTAINSLQNTLAGAAAVPTPPFQDYNRPTTSRIHEPSATVTSLQDTTSRIGVCPTTPDASTSTAQDRYGEQLPIVYRPTPRPLRTTAAPLGQNIPHQLPDHKK